MAVLAGLAILTLGITATILARYARANRRRLDDLEAKLHALTDAERIIARAHAKQRQPERRRDHLKLLGLIPVGWFASSQARLAALGAATAGVITVGLAVEHPKQSATPLPAMRSPATEQVADDPPMSNPDPRHHHTTSTSTTSTTVPAAVVPPRSAAAMGAASTPILPTDPVPPPSTTTTSTEVEPIDLPKPCTKPKVPIGLKICVPVD